MGWVAALLGLGMQAAIAAQPPGGEIQVNAKRSGEAVIIDVDLHVPVTQRTAWSVLTDFEHMPKFMPGLHSSEVSNREGNSLTVSQKGVRSVGPFSFAYESVRHVEMTPHHSIRAHAVAGSMKRMETLTTLEPDGAGTHITYHATAVPESSLLTVLGTGVVANDVREQFQSLREEMLRREAAQTKASARLPSRSRRTQARA